MEPTDESHCSRNEGQKTFWVDYFLAALLMAERGGESSEVEGLGRESLFPGGLILCTRIRHKCEDAYNENI